MVHPGPQNLRRKWRWIAAALVGACALVSVLAAVRFPLTREQELRIALTARTMAEGGDWMAPRYRGQPRFQKPPLMYWLTAGVYRLAGRTDTAIAARAASTTFALGLLALVYAGGRRLVGRRAALYGTAFAATSLLFLRFGFRSEADMPQSFFVSLSAIAAFTALHRPARAPAAWTLSGAAAGLGFLAKGLGGAALPFLAAAGATAHPRLRTRGWRSVAIALLVFAALAAPWYIAALGSSQTQDAAGAAVDKELQALFVKPTHPGPPIFYLYTLVAALAPWGLLPWLGIPALARHARRRPGVAFLAAWLVTTLIALSLLKNKQIHYCTLLLVPASLAAGLAVASAARRARNWTAVAARHYASAVALVLALAGTAFMVAPWIPSAGMPPGAAPFGAAAAAAGIAGWRLRRRGPGPVTAAVAAGILAIGLAMTGPLAELAASDFALHAAADDIRGRLPPDATVTVVGGDDATLEFHLGRPVRLTNDFAAAWAAATRGGAVVVSSSQPFVPPADGPVPVARFPSRKRHVALFLKPMTAGGPPP